MVKRGTPAGREATSVSNRQHVRNVRLVLPDLSLVKLQKGIV